MKGRIPKVSVVHPGLQHSRHLAAQLVLHRLLHRYVTGLLIHRESVGGRLVQRALTAAGFGREVENRSASGVPRKLVRLQLLPELLAIAKVRLGAPPGPVMRKRNSTFQAGIPDWIIDESDVLIGFDTAAAVIADRTKQRGKQFVLEQTICEASYAQKVLDEVALRYPEWPRAGERKSDEELESEHREQVLADWVVAPSRFVASTLTASGLPSSKIVVNPFGTSTQAIRPISRLRLDSQVRFLFLGNIGARKGVPILIEAWRRLKTAAGELVLAGTGQLPPSVLSNLPAGIRIEGPVRRSALPALLSEADVFVFPSFLEGLAQVQLEAAAAGLPIVSTTSSGAQEVVEHGVTGLIIQPGNVEALADAMERLIGDRSERYAMTEAARARSQMWDWANYGDRWATFLTRTF